MSSPGELTPDSPACALGQRLLGLFFRAWAHELNNPVQAVLAGAELIEMELAMAKGSLSVISERVTPQAREVATEVVRISEGINRLHALSRPLETVAGSCDFEHLAQEVNALWKPIGQHTGIRVRLEPSVDRVALAVNLDAAVIVCLDALTAIWNAPGEAGEVRVSGRAEGLSFEHARGAPRWTDPSATEALHAAIGSRVETQSGRVVWRFET